MAKKKSKKKQKKKKNPSPEQVIASLQRKHRNELRSFFSDLGFQHQKSDEIEIKVGTRKSDVDDLFFYENVIVLVEYTVGNVSSDHVLKKKAFFDEIISDKKRFLDIARASYEGFGVRLDTLYDDEHFEVRIIYASLNEVPLELVESCPSAIFLHGSVRKYFLALGRTIRKSARVEFFNYLGLNWKAIGKSAVKAKTEPSEYAGQLLPPSMSSYPSGYRVVSFYADPESIIAGAYVLRRDGWRDESHLYQRVLLRSKILKMRRYLVEQKRVFVNNVIVTLPSATDIKLLESDKGKNANHSQPVIVALPAGYNTIGVVDGQHRVFCYHEGVDAYEPAIKNLRQRQHLLVTGIIYPKEAGSTERMEFEAKLFLEINNNQTSTRSALRQDIETIIRPFSGIAVARRIVAALTKSGPYKGLLQLGYFDSPKKIKTSSIVSYGLRPLVKFDGDDSLFHAWPNPEKTRLKLREKKSVRDSKYDSDLDLLEEYIEYCKLNLNHMFVAAKLARPGDSWDVELEVVPALLRPTSINGLIACLRKVIKAGLPIGQASLKKGLSSIDHFDFLKYTSSGWDAMGKELFEKHFVKNHGS